jgi:hypothetical protein
MRSRPGRAQLLEHCSKQRAAAADHRRRKSTEARKKRIAQRLSTSSPSTTRRMRLGIAALSESIAQGRLAPASSSSATASSAVTAADDVNRVAVAYLKPSNRTLGQFIPDGASPTARRDSPEADAVASAGEGYTGRAAVAVRASSSIPDGRQHRSRARSASAAVQRR